MYEIVILRLKPNSHILQAQTTGKQVHVLVCENACEHEQKDRGNLHAYVLFGGIRINVNTGGGMYVGRPIELGHYVYTHTHTHTYIYTYMYTQIYAYLIAWGA